VAAPLWPFWPVVGRRRCLRRIPLFPATKPPPPPAAGYPVQVDRGNGRLGFGVRRAFMGGYIAGQRRDLTGCPSAPRSRWRSRVGAVGRQPDARSPDLAPTQPLASLIPTPARPAAHQQQPLAAPARRCAPAYSHTLMTPSVPACTRSISASTRAARPSTATVKAETKARFPSSSHGQPRSAPFSRSPTPLSEGPWAFPFEKSTRQLVSPRGWVNGQRRHDAADRWPRLRQASRYQAVQLPSPAAASAMTVLRRTVIARRRGCTGVWELHGLISGTLDVAEANRSRIMSALTVDPPAR